MNFLPHFIFIAAFIVVYVIAFIILKPFKLHKKRPVSTISLKLSYLIYLFTFILLAYLVLFFSMPENPEEEIEEDKLFTAFAIFSIAAFFIPNIGIMLRRSIKKWRVKYNYIFTGINLIFAIGLIYYIFTYTWQFN